MNTLALQRTLGFLGLIPFIVPALCALLSVPLFALDPARIFTAYSVVILAFLTGTLWGRSLAIGSSTQQRCLLLSSNIIALGAWTALLVEQLPLALILLMAGFLSVLLIELKVQALLTPAYRALRIQLSTWVLLVHGVLLVAVSL